MIQTGAAMVDAARRQEQPVHVWQWGLWADLASPNMFVPVSREKLDQAMFAMSAHEGEIARNNYVDLIEARTRAAGRTEICNRSAGFGGLSDV